jgi:segregation and condensation protein B
MSTSSLKIQPVGSDDEMATAMAFGNAVRIAEALLFAAREPLSEAILAAAIPKQITVKEVMAHLEPHYAVRGVNLVRINGKWAFRTAADLGYLMSKEVEEPKKLSRAAIETLAIIAYHQPVTRAEIEDIRGVATAKGTLDILLETNWIRMRGRRKTPGRPITFGTTEGFLSHFGLNAVGDLPGLDELKSAGMFDGRLPGSMSIPLPTDDLALRADEDPLEADELVLAIELRINTLEDPLEGDDDDHNMQSEEEERLDPLSDERRA